MSIDLLMKFVKGSDAIDAECQTSIDPKDGFMKDFKAGKFFEIDEFNFGVGLEDNEFASDKQNSAMSFGQEGGRQKVRGGRSRFEHWLSGIPRDPYPVDLEPFAFTRQMDMASPLLFQMCCDSQSFTSATLVKRKAAGQDVSGHGFLRIDFNEVLVIGVDWDSGDVVKEKCKFICRGVTVQYKPQLPDGTLGAPVPGIWSRKMARKGK